MRKYFLIWIFIFLLTGLASARSAPRDTVLVMYGYGGKRIVSSMDSADYFMLIIPPDSTDNRYIIKQYYKNGHIMFDGKADPRRTNPHTNVVVMDGDYIKYYNNGKKLETGKYDKGYLVGFVYRFYPSGRLYSCIKHNYGYKDEQLKWECYDQIGTMVCKNGSGHWLTYDDGCKNLELEGEVVRGVMEGEWSGEISYPDTIAYKITYDRGQRISSISYDKTGRTYSFKYKFEIAVYKYDVDVFVYRMLNHIHIPKDPNGKKKNIDDIKFSFTVEKNGSIDHFQMEGTADDELKNSIFAALQKCQEWQPYRIYGVPFRSVLTFTLKGLVEFDRGTFVRKELFFHEKVIMGGSL
jgi:antitoxin component YwqK of YwqJK toxin-antitoxin module